MKLQEKDRCGEDTKAWHCVCAGMMLLFFTVAILPPSPAQGIEAATTFVVVGSQFHQSDPDDAGETRICIQNTGATSLSMAQLKVRVLAHKGDHPDAPATECACVYAKLSPPVLRPSQYGVIVATLRDRPANGCTFSCTVSAAEGAASHEVPLTEPALWISYVGFSEDLQKVFVYVENTSDEATGVELLKVGPFDVAGRARAIHLPIPPKDKGCLVCDLPSPLTTGEFIHVVVAANLGERQSKVHIVVRAIRAFPVALESGTLDPRMNLDTRLPFVQTMVCPAHAYGPHEAAAANFLQDYVQRFSQDPGQVIQMHICRSGLPEAWFRFGDLPDVAVMNTCLCPPSGYDKDRQRCFCPFFCIGDLAKRATEPGRYVALVLTGPDTQDGSFLLKGLTSQEWRFLVYCALVSGAKGISYRGLPADDALSRDAFGQLNRELQRLKPLLLIAEPVEWVTTIEDDYTARGLLCGDQAILVVVFDRRYFSRQRNRKFYTPYFGRAMTPVRVNIRIPQRIAVQEVGTPFTSLDRDSWDCQNDALNLTADMVDSVQVYVAYLQWQGRPLEEGGSSR